jgi:hypothetical protein
MKVTIVDTAAATVIAMPLNPERRLKEKGLEKDEER